MAVPNVQGFLHKKTGNRYYVDGGYINKGKHVCSWYCIRQDTLEDFVLSSLKETLLAPGSIDQAREFVEQLNARQPTAIEQRIVGIVEIRRENTAKIENLLSIVEGGGTPRNVAIRLRDLEEFQDKLQEERTRPKWSIPPKLDPALIADAVRVFLKEFDEGYDEIPVTERTGFVRRMVDVILVDKQGGDRSILHQAPTHNTQRY